MSREHVEESREGGASGEARCGAGSEAASTKREYIFNTKVFLLSYDFVIGEDGLIKIYEVQNAFGTVFSEEATLSPKKERTTFERMAEKLGISPTCKYGEFRPTKTFQRRVWNRACKPLTPKNTILTPESKPKEAAKQIYQFLLDNPDVEKFVIKCNHTTASEGVVFISREKILEKMASIKGALDSNNLRKSSAEDFLSQLMVNNLPLIYHDEISFEEFISIAPNPETGFRETNRTIVAIDPTNPENTQAFHIVTYGHHPDATSASFFHGGAGYRLNAISDTLPGQGYSVGSETLEAASKSFPMEMTSGLLTQFKDASTAICRGTLVSRFKNLDQILGQKKANSNGKKYLNLLGELFLSSKLTETNEDYKDEMGLLYHELELFISEADDLTNKEAKRGSKYIFQKMLETAREHGKLPQIVDLMELTPDHESKSTTLSGRRFHKLRKLLKLMIIDQTHGACQEEEVYAKLASEIDAFSLVGIEVEDLEKFLDGPKIPYSKLVPDTRVERYHALQLRKGRGEKGTCVIS